MALFKRKLSPDEIRDRVIALIEPLTYIGQKIDLPYFLGAPAQAFEALRAEVTALRQAIEAAAERQAPD